MRSRRGGAGRGEWSGARRGAQGVRGQRKGAWGHLQVLSPELLIGVEERIDHAPASRSARCDEQAACRGGRASSGELGAPRGARSPTFVGSTPSTLQPGAARMLERGERR